MALVVDAQWSEPKTNTTEDIEAATRRNQFEVIGHRSLMYFFKLRFLHHHILMMKSKLVVILISKINSAMEFLQVKKIYRVFISKPPTPNMSKFDDLIEKC